MANRSYLYATDHLPGSPEWQQKRQLQSIGEWNYDIPLTYKLLLSGTPVPVRSSIWDTEDQIALAGNARTGLDRLNSYLDLLPSVASSLVAETREFFSRPENTRRYFILECGEIFEMEGENLAEQNLELLAEIRELPSKIASLPLTSASPVPVVAQGFFKRLFSRRPAPPTTARHTDPMEPLYKLGLGNWSSVLYYQFTEDDS